MNQYHSIYTPDSFPCFNGVAEYILSFFTVVEPLDAALQQLSHVCVCFCLFCLFSAGNTGFICLLVCLKKTKHNN